MSSAQLVMQRFLDIFQFFVKLMILKNSAKISKSETIRMSWFFIRKPCFYEILPLTDQNREFQSLYFGKTVFSFLSLEGYSLNSLYGC